MEFEIGVNLASLLATAPWATLGALALWPEKGVLALWIKRNHAVRLAEIEREKMKETILVEAAKSHKQGQLPAPIGEPQ